MTRPEEPAKPDSNALVQRRVTLIGPFPPPMHGLAAVNAEMRCRLIARGIEPRVIDLSADSLDRYFGARLTRLPRVLRALARMIPSPRHSGESIYMSVSGGAGKLYESLFVVLARIRRIPMVLHHHSFAYADRSSLIARTMFRLAGPSALHVVVSGRAGDRLRAHYALRCVTVITNAVFLGAISGTAGATRKTAVRTIGFLSNIAEEKGIFELLDLARAIDLAGLPIEVRVAGPFQDHAIERAVTDRIASLPNIRYLGALYGEQKEQFFADIDVLIFPTRYPNEAEPLTIHEALRSAAPVIAYGRGAIPEVLTEGGLVIDPAREFVPAALEQLEAWCADDEAFRFVSTAALNRFREMCSQGEVQVDRLIEGLAFGAG